MKAIWKKMLALTLAFCSVVGCMVPVSAAEDTAAASEYEYEFPEYGEPTYIGDPLTGSMTATEYVERIDHEGMTYLLVPSKGSSLYVLKLSHFLEKGGGEGEWIHDKEDTGINISRGIVLNSKGQAYIVGDQNYVYKYDFYQQTGKKIPLPSTRGACFGVTVDDNDNVYITSQANAEKDPAPVFKVTPDDQVSVFYTTNELMDLNGGCVYAEGHLYIHGKDRQNVTAGEIHKIDVATGQKVDEYRLEKTPRIFYLSYIDGVLFCGGASTVLGDGLIAIDEKTGERVDLGVERSEKHMLGLVTNPKDGKSYFYLNGIGTYEYDLATRKATLKPGLAVGVNFRIRNPYITVNSGELTGECMLSVVGSGGKPFLMSLEEKGFIVLEDIVLETASPGKFKSTVGAPAGSDSVLYIGGYLTPRVASYNPTYPEKNDYDPEHVMLDSNEFSNGHAQTDIMMEYKGKIYCGVYSGAYLVEYDPATDEVTELIHGLQKDYEQRRIHGMAVGDDKIFFSTIPDSNKLGGSIGWYDLITGEMYIERNVVPNQCVISLAYDEEKNILYGSSTVRGGTNSTPVEEEAYIMVYDVDQKKVLGNFSVRSSENKNSDMVFDLANGDVIPSFIGGVGLDTSTGKLWGVVARTVFTFKYDRKTNSLHVHEEYVTESGGKSVYTSSNGHSWLPRKFLFHSDGYLYLSLDSQNLRRFDKENPENNVIVAYTGTRCYCIGNDGNLYYGDGTELWMVPLNRISIVECLIRSIDLSNRATVKEARAAYNALTDEERAQMNPTIAADLVAKEGAAQIFRDIAVEQAIEAINDIGAITAGSGIAIEAAKKAYEAVDAECKTAVENYTDLLKAEEIYAKICAEAGRGRDVRVQLDFSKAANPNIGNSTIDLISYDHISAGNWEYADSYSATAFKFNQSKRIQMNFGPSGDGWLALRVKIPQAGVYRISVMHGNYNGCIGGVYMFSNDPLDEIVKENLLTEINKKLTTTEHCVGTVDYTKDGTTDVGVWGCTEAGEYLLVFNLFEKVDGNYGRLEGVTFTQQSPKIDETVEQVKEKIDDIGKVTLKSGDKISAARLAYDALTNAQKKLIYAPMLEAAEAEYAQIKKADDEKQAENNAAAAAVKIRIDAIGQVTVGSGNAIRAARQAYDALTKEQKKLVLNYDVLTAAEEAYAQLTAQPGEDDGGNIWVTVLIIAGSVLVAAGVTVAVVLLVRKKKKSAQTEAQEQESIADQILKD